MGPRQSTFDARHTFVQRLLAKLRDAPPVLLAYTVFAIAVTALDFGVMFGGFDNISRLYVPYTGWLASGTYAFTIFFAVFAIYGPPKGREHGRRSVAMFMLLGILFGVSRVSQIGRENFDNPYLTVSLWQPVWTIVIPGIWIALLFSPQMNRYCRQTEESQKAESVQRPPTDDDAESSGE